MFLNMACYYHGIIFTVYDKRTMQLDFFFLPPQRSCVHIYSLKIQTQFIFSSLSSASTLELCVISLIFWNGVWLVFTTQSTTVLL